jgi:hypothetical protein
VVETIDEPRGATSHCSFNKPKEKIDVSQRKREGYHKPHVFSEERKTT